MYDQILFPSDGSEPAASALAYALDVAVEHGGTLHVLNVADTARDSVVHVGGEVVDALETEGEEIVEAAADRARERGVPVETAVMQGDPAATIADYAEEYGMDIVVMPTHGRQGVERFLLGSVTERVINATDVPVLALNPDRDEGAGYPCQEVLAPTDGSRGAALAVAEGAAVAAATGGRLHLLHVVETESLGLDVRSVVEDDVLEERAGELLAAARETALESGLGDDAVTETVAEGRPHREIRDFVETNDVDLLVLGSHGEAEFSRYVLGSVTSKLLRTSPVPVLMTTEAVTE